MTAQPAPSPRLHPLLALLLGVAGLGIMGWASVVFLEMLDDFATAPWLALLPRLALAMAMFGLGFWVFVRGAAAFLRSSSPAD